MIDVVYCGAKGYAVSRGQSLRNRGKTRIAALNMNEAASDRGQDMEYAKVYKDKNGRFPDTRADGGGYNEAAKTRRCKNLAYKAVMNFHCRRCAGM